MNWITHLISDFLDLLYPPVCFHCGMCTEPGQFLCKSCQSELAFLEGELCPVCGTPLHLGICDTCAGSQFVFDKAVSIFSFNPVCQSLIHHLKYKDMVGVGRYLGAKAAEYCKERNPFSDIDLVAPIPLHPVRLRHRGFNQAGVIARAFARQMKLSYVPHLVVRARYTQTQTKLNRVQRQKNVSQAFRVKKPHLVQGRTILIMDDVFTTGATANSVAKALLNRGAERVYVLTIARA